MDYNIKSVERAFEIMKAISDEAQTPAELAKKLDMNKSTIHRFLATLIDLGYLEKLPDNYLRLSQLFINLGVNAQKQFDVVTLSRPYLISLAEEFKESSLLAMFTGNDCQYVDKIESPHAVRIVLDSGAKAPAYSVASGKVFLSSLEEDELNDYLDHTSFISYTKNTFTEKMKLKEEIIHVREAGYAIDNEEFEIGLRGFAAPIKDYRGEIIAALCIAGVAPRIRDKKKIHSIISALLYASKDISYQIGYKQEFQKIGKLKD
ncbi:IclR family transcriptional regulator [Metabacillus herbersteinensis]|uniref:IclR family transcriptional regulator n=1 Tax=Metabacillus herbersteinensis TaxID=283816 RepID=A0ABV6GE20_9BACI